MRTSHLVLVSLLAAGCAGSLRNERPAPLLRPADSLEYAPYIWNGTLELTGQAFLTTKDGTVKPAAGRLVTLDPATSYARAWFRRYGADPNRFEDPAPDTRFASARRTTVADADGRFRFVRLGAGDYLVRTTIEWRGETDDSLHGGVVAAYATVADSVTSNVIVHQLYLTDWAAALGVTIVPEEELSGRRYRVLSRVNGTACDSDSEAPARQQLVLEAARRGADAVSNVDCKRKGFSLAKGCLRRIVCEGEALVW